MYGLLSLSLTFIHLHRVLLQSIFLGNQWFPICSSWIALNWVDHPPPPRCNRWCLIESSLSSVHRSCGRTMAHHPMSTSFFLFPPPQLLQRGKFQAMGEVQQILTALSICLNQCFTFSALPSANRDNISTYISKAVLLLVSQMSQLQQFSSLQPLIQAIFPLVFQFFPISTQNFHNAFHIKTKPNQNNLFTNIVLFIHFIASSLKRYPQSLPLIYLHTFSIEPNPFRQSVHHTHETALVNISMTTVTHISVCTDSPCLCLFSRNNFSVSKCLDLDDKLYVHLICDLHIDKSS